MPPVEVAAPTQPPVDPATQSPSSISWQASEFVYQEKNARWYLILTGIAVLLAAIFAFFQQWLSIAVVAAMLAAVIVYARRQPATLLYAADDKGISINGKLSSYGMFRSYSVQVDVAWQAIDLEPTKRFQPRLTILCGGDNIAEVEEILAQHLPRTDRQPDAIERLTRYLRF